MANAPAFQAFDSQHLVALSTIVVLAALLAWGTKRSKPPARKWLGQLIGFALLSYGGVLYIQQGIDHALSWEYSLPLELCNCVLIACIASLFRPNQFASEIAYFWGLGGVLQATLTPEITRGFPSWEFALFFWSHGITMLAIVFLIAGQGFRPRRGSVVRMMVALNVYGLVVGSIDLLMDWNYGFLLYKPPRPSLLDFLGPWPWYLLSLELVSLFIFVLLDMPWRFSGKQPPVAAGEANGSQ